METLQEKLIRLDADGELNFYATSSNILSLIKEALKNPRSIMAIRWKALASALETDISAFSRVYHGGWKDNVETEELKRIFESVLLIDKTFEDYL